MISRVKKRVRGFFVGVAETALHNFSKERVPFDVERMAYLLATIESAQFFRESMPMIPNCITTYGLLAHCIKQVKVDGLWMEFGVASGGSIREIGTQTDKEVFGFDSFEGLPEDWTHFQRQGRFSRQGMLPTNLPQNVTLVKGWFSDTLPLFLKEHVEPAAFVHVDCDLYSSSKLVLTELRSRMKQGTVIVFDEFFNYPRWKEHEFRAFSEFIEESAFQYEFLGFASSHCSVGLRITDINPKPVTGNISPLQP